MWQSGVKHGAVVAEISLRFVSLVFDLGGEAEWGLPRARVEAFLHGHLKEIENIITATSLYIIFMFCHCDQN